MASQEDALIVWTKIIDQFYPNIVYRRGKLGDGNGQVSVAGRTGWNWIRYDDENSKLSMVRNLALGYLGEDTPVIVGKKFPDDGYEQVLGISWGPYSWTPPQSIIDKYITPPHGDTHHGGTGNDPAPIDLNNMANGKVVPTTPLSLFVVVQSFIYSHDLEATVFPSTTLDLTATIPVGAGHRYSLVYLNLATEVLGYTMGSVVPIPVSPPIPSSINNSIPLAVVETYFGQTEIARQDIWQYKLLWGSVGGDVPTHTHTDDTTGGSSIIGLEEFFLSCAEPIFLVGNAIYPTHTYHELHIPVLYATWPTIQADLAWVHPDPVYGCGQLLLLRVATSGLYSSYRVRILHNVGNIFLQGKQNIDLNEATDHILLVYNGSRWVDIISTYNAEVGNGLLLATVSKFADYVATPEDCTILVTCSIADVTITLPPAADNIGRVYRIKKMDATVWQVLVEGDGGELVEGAATYPLAAQYDNVSIQCDGDTWWVV